VESRLKRGKQNGNQSKRREKDKKTKVGKTLTRKARKRFKKGGRP
jgi:hypothetical protein